MSGRSINEDVINEGCIVLGCECKLFQLNGLH